MKHYEVRSTPLRTWMVSLQMRRGSALRSKALRVMWPAHAIGRRSIIYQTEGKPMNHDDGRKATPLHLAMRNVSPKKPKTPREYAIYRLRLTSSIGKKACEGEGIPPGVRKEDWIFYQIFSSLEELAIIYKEKP